MTYLYVDKEYNTREEAEEKALESIDEFDITHFLLNGGSHSVRCSRGFYGL